MFATVRKFFGIADFSFKLDTEERVVQPTRPYTSIRQAIEENNDSRILLGVHWRRDFINGTPLGEQVVDYIWNRFLRPTP